MLGSFAQLRCCHAYLRSETTTLIGHRHGDSPVMGRESTVPLRRALIVEFRDEVFAHLKSLLEDCGYEVARAASGAAVAAQVNRFAPDLMVVNEGMPDENGWLIICKLRLTQFRQPVWLYAASAPRANLKEFCRVDEVIAYGGVLSRLVSLVRERLEFCGDCASVNRGWTRHRGEADAAA